MVTALSKAHQYPNSYPVHYTGLISMGSKIVILIRLYASAPNSVCCAILTLSFPFFKEIYAPKLQEFAYVTDGACSEDDIIRMELIVLKVITVNE